MALPSEAEWEYAARGNTSRRYPWGNSLDPEKANYEATGIGRTAAVGCFPESATPEVGVEDLAGNVREWTRSKLAPYPYHPDDGREDRKGNSLRVIRGGAFLSLRSLRAARRLGELPQNCEDDIGFRIVIRQPRYR